MLDQSTLSLKPNSCLMRFSHFVFHQWFLRALNSNNFTGKIPTSLGNLTKVYWLDLADNQLTGPIPISSGSSPGLDLLLKAKHLWESLLFLYSTSIWLVLQLQRSLIWSKMLKLVVISTRISSLAPFHQNFSALRWYWSMCKSKHSFNHIETSAYT